MIDTQEYWEETELRSKRQDKSNFYRKPNPWSMEIVIWRTVLTVLWSLWCLWRHFYWLSSTTTIPRQLWVSFRFDLGRFGGLSRTTSTHRRTDTILLNVPPPELHPWLRWGVAMRSRYILWEACTYNIIWYRGPCLQATVSDRQATTLLL